MKPLGALLLLGLAACSSQAAPSGVGLCWRKSDAADPQSRFEIIARDVPNLESCAVLLEGARLIEGRPTAGAYNGYFIFATEEQTWSAKRVDGARIRVFEAADRRRIQEGLGLLVEHQQTQGAPAGSPQPAAADE